MDEKSSLRAFTADTAFRDRWATDPDAMGEFEWIAFRDAARERRRFEKDGYISKEHASIAVSPPDGTCVGVASCWLKHYGGVLRYTHFRRGAWRNLVVYSMRSDDPCNWPSAVGAES